MREGGYETLPGVKDTTFVRFPFALIRWRCGMDVSRDAFPVHTMFELNVRSI